MPEYTPNFNLYKPNRVDDLDIDTSLSDNFVKVDNSLKSVNDNVAQHKTSVDNTLDEFGTRLDTVEVEQADQDTRIDNIVAQAGSDNTEIVDARLGADGVARTVLGDLMREVHAEQVLANQQKKTLTHGMNLIESDTASDLKVEFHGNTKVNYMGREGGFHSQGKWGSNLVIDTSTYKFGTSSGKIDNSAGTAQKYSTNTQKINASGKYILIGFWAKSVSGTPRARIRLVGYNSDGSIGDNTKVNAYFDITNTWKYYYAKFDLTSNADNYWETMLYTATYGTTDDIINFDGYSVQTLTSTQFNEIGVSLTDADVERMFPYVDSIKGVKNPVLYVESQQLFNIYDVNLHDNAEITDPRTITLNASGAGETSTYNREVVGSQGYTVTLTHNAKWRVVELDGSGDIVTGHGGWKTESSFSFTTNANTKSIDIEFSNDSSGTFTFSDIMLNLGLTSVPYTDYNPSYLYAETTLAGNANKKDILYRNYDLNRWEKIKNWETDVVLDGSLSWDYMADKDGHKIVRIYEFLGSNETAVKYDGSILTNNYNVDGIDNAYFYNDHFRIGVADEDSGWGEAHTPSVTEMQANFWGWRLCDGTYSTPYNGTGTKTWYPKGDSDLARAVTSVPTSESPTITDGTIDFYKLTYQLADPVTENVTVEGSLSIEGDAQVEVNSGITFPAEEVELYSSSGEYYLNANSTSKFSHRSKKLLGVFEGKTEVTSNWRVLDDNNSTYGQKYQAIDSSKVDDSKTYTVIYTILDKYDFTTNLNEVVAHYNSSLKSSFNGVVAKQSDIATGVSILDRQMLDVLIRLDAGGL